MGYQPIENYGVVGDLHTVALVVMDGSVDFMCFPFFDSPSIFAALLDEEKGGRFQITPSLPGARQKQICLPDSNILLSRFLSAEGVAEITDFMPISGESEEVRHDLVRQVKTVRGEIRFSIRCALRFDYGRCGHRIDRRNGEIVFLPDQEGLRPLRLFSTIPPRMEEGAATAGLTPRAGESTSFIPEDAAMPESSPARRENFAERAARDTLDFWRLWVGRSAYQGRWRETVNRSALVLKLLTSKPHGSMVAAATFGLPERIGGGAALGAPIHKYGSIRTPLHPPRRRYAPSPCSPARLSRAPCRMRRIDVLGALPYL